MDDRLDLDTIKRQLALTPPDPVRDPLDRQLVAEIQRLRKIQPARVVTEIDGEPWTCDEVAEKYRALRVHLRDLEDRPGHDCPACGGRDLHGGHEPDCWLAAALSS